MCLHWKVFSRIFSRSLIVENLKIFSTFSPDVPRNLHTHYIKKTFIADAGLSLQNRRHLLLSHLQIYNFSDLRYAIDSGSIRIGDPPEWLKLTSLREHTSVERLLGQLVVGRVMNTRHQVNRDTALYCRGMGVRVSLSLSLSLSLSNSQLAEPTHHLVPSLLQLIQQNSSLSENESKQQLYTMSIVSLH